MKAIILGLGALLLGTSISLAQQQQPSSQGSQAPTLSYQTQPSEVEKGQSAVWRPKLETGISYSGPLAEIARGQNPFRPLPARTNVVYTPADDLTLDLITRRPRGLVLFAINF